MSLQTISAGSAVHELILAKAFPFHFVINNCNKLIGCGESLHRILQINPDGSDTLFDHFTIQHPVGVTTFDEFKLQANTFFLLKSTINSKLILRGQLIFSPDTDQLFFLVSPWVTELDVLIELGLTLNDFPLHSPLSDILILLQAQKASLADSKRLSNDLSALNKELEDRVTRRTQALEENAQELRDSKQSLEREMHERARVEIELRHAQKLESVGQLAAGIAHEINTPMQYIGNSLHFIKSALSDYEKLSVIAENLSSHSNDHLDDKSSMQENVFDTIDLAYIRDRAPKALDRALDGIAAVTKIVQAMNEFTHPDGDEKKEADINRALNTAATVARNEYKYVANLIENFQPLPSVECHIGDLNQVFLNLIINAAHSVSGHTDGMGKITISTWAESDVVKITVADNGSGIPEDIRHRVFDPFFTTKEVGRGTGQGLTISHNIIVNKHGGQLDFTTEKGKGTTFQITLPIVTVTNSDDSYPFNHKEDLAA
ncbi:MAG: sensor histidine kinase [Granulosicoccus sp.]